jgi:hypothetical protein
MRDSDWNLGATLFDGFRGKAPEGWAMRLLRGLLSLLCSAALVCGVAFFGLRFHLWWLGSLLLPGVFVGAVFAHLFPGLMSGAGGLFSGLGEMFLVGAIADWLFYAFVLYLLLTFARRKSNNVDDNVD